MAGVSREEPGLGDHSLTIGRRLTLNFSAAVLGRRRSDLRDTLR